MSADEDVDDIMVLCCASCGKAEVDDVKLKSVQCNLVKDCSVNCQKNHRPKHKKACKKKMGQNNHALPPPKLDLILTKLELERR